MPSRTHTLTPARALPLLAAWATGVGLAVSALPALAEVTPYYIGITQTFAHDNNLLRLGNGQVAPEGYTRADTISSTALQGGIDQHLGRQRLNANLSLRDTRYRGNSLFNNQGYTGSVGLDWSTIERISGSLSASANRSLSNFNPYEVGLLPARNYEDTRNYGATFNVGLVTQYSLELGATHRDVTNTLDLQSVQSRNFRQDGGSVALRWRPSGATSLALVARQNRGLYPRFRLGTDGYQADRYRQDTLELSANLNRTGASTIDLRIGQSRQRYDLNEARSFSGVTGGLGWDWQATGKLRFITRISRDTGQDSYAVTVFSNVPGSSDNSRLVDILRVDASYEFSAKVAFTSAYQLTQRKVVQTVVNPLLPLNASGRDLSNALTLGVRWTPTRTSLLGCEASHDDRRAHGELTVTLSAASYNCYGQIQFQP